MLVLEEPCQVAAKCIFKQVQDLQAQCSPKRYEHFSFLRQFYRLSINEVQPGVKESWKMRQLFLFLLTLYCQAFKQGTRRKPFLFGTIFSQYRVVLEMRGLDGRSDSLQKCKSFPYVVQGLIFQWHENLSINEYFTFCFIFVKDFYFPIIIYSAIGD